MYTLIHLPLLRPHLHFVLTMASFQDNFGVGIIAAVEAAKKKHESIQSDIKSR